MIQNYNDKIFIILIILSTFNSNIINNPNISFTNITNIENEQNNTKKNLIIGAIENYPWNKIRNFFISLNKVGFKNCDFIMFIDKISQEAIDNLKNLGVILYDTPRKILGTRALVQNYRFKIYEDFLTENKDKYNMVFTADIRDTIFQKDIFEFYNFNKSFLGAFYEDDIIKNTQTNSDW